MLNKTNSSRLDFIIKSGIAKGWKAVLTNVCLENHKQKYALMPESGAEYFDDDFIDSLIEKGLNNPKYVYPNIKLVSRCGNKKELEIINGNEWVLFYSKFENKNFTHIENGSYFIENIKIIIKRNISVKLLEIIGFRRTSHIPEQKYIYPLTKITDTNFRVQNDYILN